MKRTIFAVIALFFLSAAASYGQFRDQQNSSSDYTGPILKQQQPEPGNWSNLFNMTMDHSYSMMFSSFGGQYQNINAYTNTMRFFFSEDLTGRVDLSLLHSPFGNSFLNNNNSGAQIIIRNAELNYQLGDRSNISIHFQQVPAYGYGFGTNPWSLHQRRSIFDRNY